MDFFEKYNLTSGKIIKSLGIFFLGLIVLFFSFGLINSLIRSLSVDRQYYAPSSINEASFGYDSAMKSSPEMELSARNVVDYDGGSTGSDLEDFEVTEYSANIETRKLDNTCDTIISLKGKDYVIFENSDERDNSCNYRFKVEKGSVEEVLAVINSLNPRELNENIKSIKKQIEDFTSEEEILKRKLEVIDETLSSAIVSYDEISKLATQTRDASSLANIIDSKIKIIERLSQDKINTSAQLERLSRSKAEQLDRLAYTYFNVYVYENKYLDIKQLKDSWKLSIKNFFYDMNKVLQDLSIGLVTLIAYTFQYLLYLIFIVITAKYVWKFFRNLWKR